MGKIIKNKKIIVLLILFGVFGVISVVFALEVAWPKSPAETPLNDTSNLTDLIKYLYEWGIAIGGLAAFIALVIAGFQYLTSMGNPSLMKEAKGRITSAFLGLVLLLGSWLILNTINPRLTTLSIPGLDYEITNEKLNESFENETSDIKKTTNKFSEIKNCDKVTVTYTWTDESGHSHDAPVPLSPNDCTNLAHSIVAHVSLKSQSYVNYNEECASEAEEDFCPCGPDYDYCKFCMGQIKLYAHRDCDSLIIPIGVNNESFTPGNDVHSLILDTGGVIKLPWYIDVLLWPIKIIKKIF